jgi:hypothetical protein
MATKTIDPEVNEQLSMLFEQNPIMYFDESLFAAACESIGQGSEAEKWSKQVTLHSRPDRIFADIPPDLQLPVAKQYVKGFKQKYKF